MDFLNLPSDSEGGRRGLTLFDLSRAQDLKDKKDRIIYRFFEVLPGLLSWGTLAGVFILSWLAPFIIAFFIIIFALYWVLKVAYLSFHQVSSFQQMRKNLEINWLEKLNNLQLTRPTSPASELASGRATYNLQLKNWQDIYHLVILPTYKEGPEIIRTTFESLVNSDYPKNNLIVVLATEERAGKETQETAREMEKEFSGKFFRFLITIHPQKIPGEIAGKGSNVAWAVKEAKEKILDKFGILPEKVIVSNFDIDTRPYSQYFSCLTYHYLTAENPLRASYQPVPIYNNNIWQAPSFSRVIATSGTFWQMMQQARPEQLVTYSSHAVPLKLILEVGYPSNLVSDDSRIFWKSYLAYRGDYRVIPLHYPVSMDAVLAKNLLNTIINQYKQQRRWAWGVENIPYLFYGFLKIGSGRKISSGRETNKTISIFEKFRHIFIVLEGFWSWATASLLIFFLGWLPLALGGEDFGVTLLAYNLPKMVAILMTLAMIGMLVSAAISFLILPARPKKYSKLKNLSMVFQWCLLPVTLIVFGVFPALEAQTRLMLGKPLGFWVTEKARS